jgi:hypothetical protein
VCNHDERTPDVGIWLTLPRPILPLQLQNNVSKCGGAVVSDEKDVNLGCE